MFKLVRRLLLAILVIGIIAMIARNTIGIWIGENILEHLTGFPTTIDQLEIKLNKPFLVARGVTISNPKGIYGEPRAIKIHRLEASYNLNTLFNTELHLLQLAIDIDSVIVVKSMNGELNLRRLCYPNSNPPISTSKPIRKLKIDELALSIGEIGYLDESFHHPELKTYKIHIKNRIYKNLNNVEDVKKMVVHLVIQSLANNILNEPTQTIGKNFQKAADIFNRESKKLLKFLETKE